LRGAGLFGAKAMKLLGLSDIHGNVEAVRKLRERERSEFDAVVVAGDIGGKAATEIMGILATFACPVMYVFGNWDRQLPYDSDFGPVCHHLHLRSVACGGWAFAGFSGLPTSWGMNPIATALLQEVKGKHVAASPDNADYLSDLRKASEEAGRLNRRKLAAVVKGSPAGPSRTIVVTHDRLFRIESDLPEVPIHLFGHRHGFKMTTYKGTKFVNVSALDDFVTVRPSNKAGCGLDDLRNVNAGSYTIIEIDGDRVDARPIQFEPQLDGWTVVPDQKLSGVPWLREGELPK
jgi:predicted phosphodiesterase